MRSLIGAVVLLASAAQAADEAKKKSVCGPVSEFVKNLPDAVKMAEASPKAFFFLEGIYAENPMTPPGLPDADHALIVSSDKSDKSVVVFIRGRDSTAKICAMPMTASKSLLDLIKEIDDGPGEPL